MFKFLRLYQGWILAVFGTLLLIVFLLPQAIEGLFQYSAVTGGDWATVDGDTTVSNGELMQVQGELRVVELVGNQVINGLGAQADPAYWYLLSREAEQAGLVGGTGVGRDMLTAMSEQLAARGSTVPETELLIRMMGSAQFSDQDVFKTLAKIQGVNQLAARYQTAARYSDERLRQAAAELGLAVDADLVIIDARKEETPDAPATDDASATDGAEASDTETTTASTEPTPDEATLQAQYEAHKADKPGEGTSGFGYRLPDRARIEWIAVNKADIEASVNENAQFDPIEMRKEFLKDPAAFGANAVGTTKPEFVDFQDAVRARMLKDLIDERMREVEKFLGDQAQLPRRGLERSGTGYVLPDDWADRRTNFAELANALGEEFQMSAPSTSSAGEFLTASDIDTLPGIGNARSSKYGRRAIRTSEFVMASSDFETESPIPSQTGVASSVFKDAPGNLYVFRVVETDPAREPNTLDEVRDDVVRDTKALARFKKLVADKSALETQAVDYGLQPIAEKFDTSVKFVANIARANPEFLKFGIKSPTRIAGLSKPEDVIDAILKRAAELDYTVPATDLPAAERTFIITDEENLAVVAVQITAVKPLTQEAWAELAQSAGMLRVLATEETALDFTESFSFDELAARHQFKLVRTSEDTDETTEDQDNSAADQANAAAGSTDSAG